MTDRWTGSTTWIGRIVRHARNRRARCRATVAILLTASSLAATTVQAQEPLATPPHVRPERGVGSLVAEAARRSPLIRALIERLEGLDVIVYVRVRPFVTTALDGRIALVSASGSGRYLAIELACERSVVTQMATLGHELYHAVEIAQEPAVVSPDALAGLYLRIGQQTADEVGLRTFETDAAAEAGRRARRELLSAGTRNAPGT